MKILAIDTAETTAAAAITENEAPLASRSVTGTLTHSETMLPMILELFAETGLSASDIDLFACSAGPGSFTGVRIGVSLIKGLAFGRNKPCAGVSATEALAYNLRDLNLPDAPEGFYACPVMDARRGRFYNALYLVKSGLLTRLCPDRAVTSEELAAELLNDRNDKPVILCGGGTQLAAAAFSGIKNVRAADSTLVFQSGVSAAVCAYRDFTGARSFLSDDITLSPIYLRPAQADRLDFT